MGGNEFNTRYSARTTDAVLGACFKPIARRSTTALRMPSSFAPETENKSGLWRYRVGDYRIVADIEDDVLVILVVDVDHRSKVYRTRR